MGETETGVVRRGVGPRLKRRRPGQVRRVEVLFCPRTLGRLLERQQFWLVYQPPRRSLARFSKRATGHQGWLSSVERRDAVCAGINRYQKAAAGLDRVAGLT